MLSSATEGDVLGRVGDEASPSMSPSMEGVLPIRGVDGNTGPNERACFLRRGCTTLHLNAFVSGMCLPLHPMLRRILRAYDLALTQPMKLSKKKKGREEEAGWYYFCPWGSHKPLVTGCHSSIKQWKVSWFWVSDFPPRCEHSRDIVDIVRSIYQADPKTRSYGLILNRHRCLRKVIDDLSREGNREAVEASKVIEVDDAPEGKVSLSWKRKARASGIGTSQAKENAVEAPGGGDGGPYDSKRRFRELIGAPGERIPDDALRNLSFYPSMGAHAVKKYFTPKWEEFSSHGELEDVLEASLASVIRASVMQMKVLGEFRTRMHEQRKLIAEASKSDKEHRQALEGLQAALDSTRTACEQMESDFKESDSNEKRRLLEEAKSRDEEIQSLRKDLESYENGRKEAEVGRKEVEAKMANTEAEFVANFHNTEAYTNFSDYFARIGQQEVLTALRNDHPNFDLGPLEARFPLPDVEGGEEN
ncbi:hypothetical protein Adt_36469 [Abeliophyllum distichum]|uniref:Uncharacterized protein n=1 Tax=Abeliophyllum distichum TaxID=126358 RepID=A0ABD1QJL0_9LAMI